MSAPSEKGKGPEPSGPAPTGSGSQYVPFRIAGITIGMPDSPLTPAEPLGEGFHRQPSAAEYQSKAESQRRYFEDLADRVQRGCPTLVFIELITAAQAIRAYASQIPTARPRARGQAPKIDAAVVSVRFLEMVLKGKSKFEAYGELAQQYGVSETSIKKAIKKHKEQVDLVLENHSQK